MISRLLSKWPSQKALVFASIVGLLSLVVTAMGLINPKPILVVLGMSLAQGLGAVAFFLFIFTVFAEYRRDTAHPAPTAAPQPPEKS